jgi:hypothetical protein
MVHAGRMVSQVRFGAFVEERKGPPAGKGDALASRLFGGMDCGGRCVSAR